MRVAARFNDLSIVYVVWTSHGNKDDTTSIHEQYAEVYMRIPLLPGVKIRGVDALFIIMIVNVDVCRMSELQMLAVTV